ncbi:MAG: sensor histidine kinase [Acidaminococcaceae bacterium]
MFERLRKKLTGIYMLIFSLFLVAFASASFYVVLMAFASEEREIMLELVRHEGEEYVEDRELPVTAQNVADAQGFAYMLSPDGKAVIDQFTESPYAKHILDQKSEWPETDDDVAFLLFTNDNGERALFIAARSELIENGKILGTLYMFRNLTVYYQAVLTSAGIIFLLILLFLAIAGYIGYYLAGKNLEPIKVAFQQQKEFVADASHELRTPMTVLAMAAEALSTDQESKYSDFAMRVVNDIKFETKKMNNLVENLMTLARGDSKAWKMDLSWFCLNDEIKQTLLSLNYLAETKGVSFSWQLPEERVDIFADRRMLMQLITILVDNALKYTEAGKMVCVNLKKEDNKAVITVKDEGMGMTVKDQTRIFERFYRVDRVRSRTNGGFGLGLPIAKLIVKKHHGNISVSSTLNVGSSFVIKLPLNFKEK